MKFTSFSDKGGLISNNDRIKEAYENGIYCFAAADGFGSRDSGAKAAELTVSAIISAFSAKPELSTAAARAYIEAAQCILLENKESKEDMRDMAASAALFLTDGTSAVWAHIGSPRIYILRRSRIIEVTEDHSAAFESFREGEIEYNDIRTQSDRNKLRRVIGDRLGFYPEISDVIKINSAFSFLICTDGFWEFIHEPEIEKAALISMSSKGWMNNMLKKISPRLETGSDNLSAYTIVMQKGDAF